ncbi:LytTr DNA-binding domain family [Verrucomicrobiia bacterium DG1235]|nr:LytTr DNA-binding domain family [Verrucomicrobiae bacterium DG1235]
MPPPLKILIVDDEPPARAKLKLFLSDCLPDATLYEAANGTEALELLESAAPDLAFLDIQMPGMTGLEVVEAFGPEEMPPLIFTTAYDQYAVKAFEHNAVDYLLKPFDDRRFRKALDKATSKLVPSPTLDSALLTQLAASIQQPSYLERIMVRENDRIIPILVSDIHWLEADDKYVRIHLSTSKRYIRNTISNLEKRLDTKNFVRTHRSTIVNLDQIQELESLTHGDYQIRLKSGTTLPLSRRYADHLKDNFFQ